MAEKVIVNGYKAIVTAKAKTVIADALDLGEVPTLTATTVTPGVTAQTITAPTGTAYNEINVNAVTAGIDANIQPGNIAKDVVILGVTGTLE